MQLLLGAGHGHIAQPPLLLHLQRVADGPDTGEDAVLQPHGKHHGELQSLGRVHGHHHHAVLSRVVVVQVGEQGNRVQKARQSGLGSLADVIGQGGLQLPDVFQPGAVFHRVLGLQGGGVAGFIQQLLVKLRQGKGFGQGAQFVHKVCKLGQPGRGVGQRSMGPGIADNLPQGHALLPGQILGLIHGFGADAPGGHVDDAAQAQVVGGVVQGVEIGQHVLDLRPVEEAGAADDAIGNAVALTGGFQLVGLGVEPIQNGVVLPPPALGVSCQNLSRHVLGLVVFVHGGIQPQRLPCGLAGPEIFTLAALIVADDGVGRLKNMLGGAVILLQADHPGALVLLLEGQNVFDGRPSEAVDGLVVVPHHADVPVPPRQGGHQQVLQMIGVLIFVDEDVAELILVIPAHLLVVLEQAHGVEDNVVKIQRGRVPQPLLVFHINPGNRLFVIVPLLFAAGQIVPGQLHGILGAGNVPQHRPGNIELFVQIKIPKYILNDPLGVGGVVNCEGGAKPQAGDVPPENAHAGGVKGEGPNILSGGTKPVLQPGLQLSGGLVCKGYSKDGPGGGGLQRAQALHPRPAGLLRAAQVRAQEGKVLLGDPIRHLPAV
ncbi:hypothetical protein SDC9_101816 [bioreactor metagenome]|uniref:Uncharacterized protein n=1 Tax=bioreactor metagenome TaxID=1076179 RepID=A0A645ART8_9ZZZZ